jgi:hypothetical protein
LNNESPAGSRHPRFLRPKLGLSSTIFCQFADALLAADPVHLLPRRGPPALLSQQPAFDNIVRLEGDLACRCQSGRERLMS